MPEFDLARLQHHARQDLLLCAKRWHRIPQSPSTERASPGLTCVQREPQRLALLAVCGELVCHWSFSGPSMASPVNSALGIKSGDLLRHPQRQRCRASPVRHHVPATLGSNVHPRIQFALHGPVSVFHSLT